MALLAEVIGKNYYTRINGETREAPIGHRMVVRGIPKQLSNKLKEIKEVDDNQLIVNDSPEAAKLRDEGKPQAADKLLAAEKEKAAKKTQAKKPAEAKPDLPKPGAKT